MTAIPAAHDSDIILICDHCGRTCDNGYPPPLSWEELWLRATGAGWRGRHRPVGPHFCFRCDD